MKRIVIGMSGGVDSSVSALLLKRQGYEVIGVFMKNWSETDDNGVCTSTTDWEDVQQVCASIDIPCYAVNFEKEYQERVFSYFISEYKKGRTPNPDVLCNREIKFKAFLDYAIQLGADYIATGHFVNRKEENGKFYLCRGKDSNKDQSYFLYMLKEHQIKKALFPVGQLTKQEVREIAEKEGLSTFSKKDSTGICFIGERNFRTFLQNYLPMQKGEMQTESGKVVGEHIGLCYYTLGQRKGLGIGGCGDGRSWFVIDKDMERNVLVVSQGDDSSALYHRFIYATDATWITDTPAKEGERFSCTAKFRYRQPDQEVFVTQIGDELIIEAVEEQRAITPGQSVVLYKDDVCLGGGIVNKSSKQAL